MRNGLCDSCRHQRVVRNTRGSVFSLCERSKSDPRYPKYPRVPVLECAGFEPRDEEGEAPRAARR
ncbi:MAG TPA: hypothetical protein VFQ14_01885 [Thermoleophilaceae bacterium]|nr:hypothetical protein [Thermoleophilaceae bacterium]